MLLKVTNLNKSFGDRTIFEGAGFELERGEKLAIIGGNGAGKTTILEILVRNEEDDNLSSAVQWERDALFEYLPQELLETQAVGTALENFPVKKIEQSLSDLSARMGRGETHLLPLYDQTVAGFEAAGGYDKIDEFISAALHLGLKCEQLDQPLRELSGGERMRVALARILVSEADCLILDEPTNHLDITGIEWLETFLKNTPKSLILVSHDRHLIDQVASATLAIENYKLIKYSGNYSDRLLWEESLEHERQLREKKVKKQLAHELKVAQTLLSHRKISSYHSRLKKAEKLTLELEETQRKRLERERRLNFQIAQRRDHRRRDRVLILAQNLSVDYGRGPLFTPRDFVITEGQKQMITGPNGCGKTSLLMALCAQLDAAVGSLRHGQDLKWARLEQRVCFEDEERTVLEEMQERFPDFGEAHARALLARFAFYDLEVFKTLGELSGGERTRLSLLFNLMEQPDILILDEPTNHLDMDSKEVLERALVDFEGAILAVSHDRHFIEKLGAQIWGFVAGEVCDASSWTEYRQRLIAEESKASTAAEAEPKVEAPHPTRASSSPDSAAPEPPSWDERELELLPALRDLPRSVNKAVELRQYRAKGRLMTAEILKQLHELQEANQSMTEAFATAKDEEIYHQYAAQVQIEEDLTEIYLKLETFLEEIST